MEEEEKEIWRKKNRKTFPKCFILALGKEILCWVLFGAFDNDAMSLIQQSQIVGAECSSDTN
jgi:hypothetical protein